MGALICCSEMAARVTILNRLMKYIKEPAETGYVYFHQVFAAPQARKYPHTTEKNSLSEKICLLYNKIIKGTEEKFTGRCKDEERKDSLGGQG